MAEDNKAQPNMAEGDKPVAPAEVNPTETNPLETTTAKDTALPVNQAKSAEPTSTPVVVSKPVDETTFIQTGSALSPTPSGDGSLPEKPIVVSDAEIANAPGSPENLSSEIEELSGEIQALEAKIDRLTGAATTSNETKVAPSAPKPEAAPTTPPPDSSKTTSPMTDIYAKVAERKKEAEQNPGKTTPDLEEAEDIGTFSGIGTIGEILAIFGIVIALVMLASPLFKELLPSNLWDALRQIGWPTGGIALFIGFLLLMFAKGKIILKLIAFIMFIIAALLYLGATGNAMMLGPLADYLSGIFSFYQ